ncbi:hypothetical protein PFBG_05890 [Plasmodium falciparum 7G8]|uniref:Rifin n=1 Tax=Plasmodium falciparum (isolate 7G8) TaxID=57266 RepID=W7F0D7_PLAF8|nr:hypothetical protein PFBG_05890 [Plasmodium falciparum 7G8]
MKLLHYCKVLLFSLPLNILSHNKNKPYITPHIPTTISRVLSKCDIQSSIYDNDAEMKSVKENFDRQTSQRFDEYEERMKGKRQKRKEERDKNIQEIIEKDKMEKSLAEKIEKGCLKCGCGLGGVAAGVGIIGPIAVNEWAKAALLAAKSSAIAEGAAAAKTAGDLAGVNALIQGINTELGLPTLFGRSFGSIFNVTNYTDVFKISHVIYTEFHGSCVSLRSVPGADYSMCSTIMRLDPVPGYTRAIAYGRGSYRGIIESHVNDIITKATKLAETTKTEMTASETLAIESAKKGAIETTCAIYHTAIIASIVAILVIVLVMVVIYLILRYRRKKKMNKKQQYTKLLKE